MLQCQVIDLELMVYRLVVRPDLSSENLASDHVTSSLCPDRAGHPALPVRLVGDALPAAEAGGGRTFAPASC